MRPTKTAKRRSLQIAAMASASVCAMFAVAQPAHADGNPARPIKPHYGNIQPFYGNIQPFYGNIQPFYGNLHPFYGNLHPFFGAASPFWGDVTTFWGADGPFAGRQSRWWGTMDPMKAKLPNTPEYTRIAPFWTKSGQGWTALNTSWNAATDYAPVAADFRKLLDEGGQFWGASVQAKTGKSYNDAVVAPLLAKYGINLNDPASLASVSETKRAVFYLDFYDTLMNFAGTDHVDHWMKTANWSPNLTQTQGSGQKTVIGLLDFTVVGDTTLLQSIVKYDGISTFSNGHGAAVGSLIVGAHDGRGVMGIAPKASVIAYNPFDSTGTASWADVQNGIMSLAKNGSSIINMSLGVPGSTFDQGWNDVFRDKTVSRNVKDIMFVTAAGNEGVAQTTNIEWSYKTNPTIIVVGSVDLLGNISNFSNRPGSACLLDNGVCKPGNELKNRFIVAPGELILMSDDHGGIARQSGTSFSTPLVSGAIALLHDRWPWLTRYPGETADMILKSAKDLGAPGVDEVYGVGLLDIQASQSPLSFNDLIWFVPSGTSYVQVPVAQVVQTYNTEKQKTFDAQGFYYYAYEPIGQTFRDFAIPLTDKLVGQTFTAASGYQAYFQSYLLGRMDAWVKTQGFADATNAGGVYQLGKAFGGDMTLAMAPRAAGFGFRDTGPAYQTAIAIQGERTKVAFGFGDGAVAMGAPGFGLASDYNAERGGANPLLGLASGGGYASFGYQVAKGLTLTTGLTSRDERREDFGQRAIEDRRSGAHDYKAAAQHVSLDWQAADHLKLTGAWTVLHEANALLGVQSLDASDFRNGSTTEGFTFGASWEISPRLSLAAAGTTARTRADGGQNITVADGGLDSQAFQVSLTGRSLLRGGDAMRLTLAQPMRVKSGGLDVRSVEVIDRATGELGIVSHALDVSEAPTYSAELLYSAPVLDNRSDVAFFGRVETSSDPGSGGLGSYMAGARFRFGF